VRSGQVEALHDIACECMQMIVENLPTRSLIMGAERNDLVKSGTVQWQIPKFHAMLHAASSIVLFGPWSNCSAEVVESCHVYMKRLADLTNQRKGQWKTQILTHVARSEEADNKLGPGTTANEKPGPGPHDGAEADKDSDGWAHVTLSKSNLVAGIRFNVWELIVGWRMCRHNLVYPAQRKSERSNAGISIGLGALVTVPSSLRATSEWIRYCRDMKDLPHFLCGYIQATYHHNLPDVPAPTDDAGSFLSAPEVHARLLSLVQVHSEDCRYLCEHRMTVLYTGILI
jgi:hypothetical protein